MTSLKINLQSKHQESIPYLQSYWTSLDINHQKLIIDDLHNKGCKDLSSFIDVNENDKYAKMIFSETTGEIFKEIPCDLRVRSKIFKLDNPISSLSNTDKAYEYFKTYKHLDISVDPMSYSLTKNLSFAAATYLEYLSKRVCGKNYCLIFTSELIEIVGKNSYRKSKQELCSKGLVRDVITKLPKGIGLLQVNPLLMYRGKSISENSTPMWNWFNEGRTTCKG
jgi:hypothetical protein